jgi:hypothetical protein
MARTQIQLRRFKYLLEDVWESPGAKTACVARFRQSLSEVESPEELHHFVLKYNWDDGVEHVRSRNRAADILGRRTLVPAHHLAAARLPVNYATPRERSRRRRLRRQFGTF